MDLNLCHKDLKESSYKLKVYSLKTFMQFFETYYPFQNEHCKIKEITVVLI